MPLPGVNDMLALFAQRGIAYAGVTNNSTLTPEQYEAKLAAMGIAIPAAHGLYRWRRGATWRASSRAARRPTTFGMNRATRHGFFDGYFIYDGAAP